MTSKALLLKWSDEVAIMAVGLVYRSQRNCIMKNFFQKILRLFRVNRNPGYIYPIDEEQFEKDPTKIRTSEISQFQDIARDIETRNHDRDVFESKVYKATKESLENPEGDSDHAGG